MTYNRRDKILSSLNIPLWILPGFEFINLHIKTDPKQELIPQSSTPYYIEDANNTLCTIDLVFLSQWYSAGKTSEKQSELIILA